MRTVMWVCNTLDDKISIRMGMRPKKPESWVYSLLGEMAKIKDIRIIYLFPNDVPVEKEYEGTVFVSFQEHNDYKYRVITEKTIEKYIIKYSPDVIHVFGTEYPHALAVLKCAQNHGLIDKTVIQIQGMVSKCIDDFFAFLPYRVRYGVTFRNVLLHDSLAQLRNRLIQRAIYETQAIKLTKHVIGRTEWDRAVVTSLNGQIQYHRCDEPLRGAFYNRKWDYNNCEKYSIFVSQANIPLKGFHLMIDALATIKAKYPSAHLYTTGNDPRRRNLIGRLKQSRYQRYIANRIHELDLDNSITFLGFLDEEKMACQFLKSNVFVLCSTIENSPNSLGEAMILGVPCVAADVGGIASSFSHNVDGFLYPANEIYMLAYYVMKVFENPNLQRRFSVNAIRHASETHDKSKILETLLSIYSLILD